MKTSDKESALLYQIAGSLIVSCHFPAFVRAWRGNSVGRMTLMSRVVASVLIAAAALPAAAQGTAGPAKMETPAAPDAKLQAAYDAAFQETLKKPADPPTLLKYAELAVKVGNLEGAISALERLLLIDGDNPELMLELGVLYFRLGAFEPAKGYLEAAQASKRATPETKQRAAAFLKEAATQ